MKTLSVTAIGVDAEPRSTLATAVTAEGFTGSGTKLTVQAFANGVSINEKTL
ncbi:MAG: hypothetical protein HUJ11_02590, partial [Arenibacter algicola]|nr:hypothetical protein [Arenibacter algicola]